MDITKKSKSKGADSSPNISIVKRKTPKPGAVDPSEQKTGSGAAAGSQAKRHSTSTVSSKARAAATAANRVKAPTTPPVKLTKLAKATQKYPILAGHNKPVVIRSHSARAINQDDLGLHPVTAPASARTISPEPIVTITPSRRGGAGRPVPTIAIIHPEAASAAENTNAAAAAAAVSPNAELALVHGSHILSPSAVVQHFLRDVSEGTPIAQAKSRAAAASDDAKQAPAVADSGAAAAAAAPKKTKKILKLDGSHKKISHAITTAALSAAERKRGVGFGGTVWHDEITKRRLAAAAAAKKKQQAELPPVPVQLPRKPAVPRFSAAATVKKNHKYKKNTAAKAAESKPVLHSRTGRRGSQDDSALPRSALASAPANLPVQPVPILRGRTGKRGSLDDNAVDDLKKFAAMQRSAADSSVADSMVNSPAVSSSSEPEQSPEATAAAIDPEAASAALSRRLSILHASSSAPDLVWPVLSEQNTPRLKIASADQHELANAATRVRALSAEDFSGRNRREDPEVALYRVSVHANNAANEEFDNFKATLKLQPATVAEFTQELAKIDAEHARVTAAFLDRNAISETFFQHHQTQIDAIGVDPVFYQIAISERYLKNLEFFRQGFANIGQDLHRSESAQSAQANLAAFIAGQGLVPVEKIVDPAQLEAALQAISAERAATNVVPSNVTATAPAAQQEIVTRVYQDLLTELSYQYREVSSQAMQRTELLFSEFIAKLTRAQTQDITQQEAVTTSIALCTAEIAALRASQESSIVKQRLLPFLEERLRAATEALQNLQHSQEASARAAAEIASAKLAEANRINDFALQMVQTKFCNYLPEERLAAMQATLDLLEGAGASAAAVQHGLHAGPANIDSHDMTDVMLQLKPRLRDPYIATLKRKIAELRSCIVTANTAYQQFIATKIAPVESLPDKIKRLQQMLSKVSGGVAHNPN